VAERSFDAAYDRQLRCRLRRLGADLGDRLPPEDRDLVAELIDANACGLALATIGDAMAAAGLALPRSVAREIARRERAMGLPGGAGDAGRDDRSLTGRSLAQAAPDSLDRPGRVVDLPAAGGRVIMPAGPASGWRYRGDER